MKYRYKKRGEIKGQLDVLISHNEDEYDGEVEEWDEVLIHGDPKGLKSFAKLLIEIAELNQENVDDKYLPIGAREHYHLRPRFELSGNSVELIVGRLDAKGTGVYHEGFIPRDEK